MINFANPVIKRFIENVHKSIERKSKNLSNADYEEYVLENRIIKLFCEDKALTPRLCADEMNIRYKTELKNEDIISVLKANRLSYQAKRAELIEWAEDMADTFYRALESRKQKDFDDYTALRDKAIHTRDDDRYKIQERIAYLMLYVRHPELFSDTDAVTIEKFGNVYMKHLLFDITDFLKNICSKTKGGVNLKVELLATMTIEDFLLLLYAKYPEIADGINEEMFEKFRKIYLKDFLREAKDLYNDFGSGMTDEKFWEYDIDSQSLLIAPTVKNSI